MSLVWLDGWDTYSASADLPLAGYTGSNYTLNASGGRFGGKYVSGSNGSLINNFPGGALTEVWFGVAANWNGTAPRLFSLVSPFGVELTFGVSSGGAVYVWRGDFGTQLGSDSSTTSFTSNAWHWVEVRAKFSSTVGEVEIWVDGVSCLSLTGQNTKNNGSATGYSGISFGSGATGQNWLFDDFYVVSTAGASPTGRLGDSRIDCVVPTSDASPNNGTPSTAGSHFAMVDEAGYNTTDYVDISATAGQEERFGVGSVGGTIASVWGVKVSDWCEKTDAGACSVKNEVVSGSSVGLGTAYAPTTSWAQYSDIFPVDPATSAAWTSSAVAAMKIGAVIQ